MGYGGFDRGRVEGFAKKSTAGFLFSSPAVLFTIKADQSFSVIFNNKNISENIFLKRRNSQAHDNPPNQRNFRKEETKIYNIVQ